MEIKWSGDAHQRILSLTDLGFPDPDDAKPMIWQRSNGFVLTVENADVAAAIVAQPGFTEVVEAPPVDDSIASQAIQGKAPGAPAPVPAPPGTSIIGDTPPA